MIYTHTREYMHTYINTHIYKESQVRGFLELASWHCISAQVKDGFHVVIWTTCKRTHNLYETSCGFRLHSRGCLYVSGSIISLSIGPDYQCKYQYHMLGRLINQPPIIDKLYRRNVCFISFQSRMNGIVNAFGNAYCIIGENMFFR